MRETTELTHQKSIVFGFDDFGLTSNEARLKWIQMMKTQGTVTRNFRNAGHRLVSTLSHSHGCLPY